MRLGKDEYAGAIIRGILLIMLAIGIGVFIANRH